MPVGQERKLSWLCPSISGVRVKNTIYSYGRCCIIRFSRRVRRVKHCHGEGDQKGVADSGSHDMHPMAGEKIIKWITSVRNYPIMRRPKVPTRYARHALHCVSLGELRTIEITGLQPSRIALSIRTRDFLA